MLSLNLGAAIKQDNLAIVRIDIAGQTAAGKARYCGIEGGLQGTVQRSPLGDDEIPVREQAGRRGLSHRGRLLSTRSATGVF